MNQAIRNALDDLETAVAYVENYADSDSDYDAAMIQESIDTIRDELNGEKIERLYLDGEEQTSD